MKPEIKVPVTDQSALKAKGFFFAGGSYKGTPGNSFWSGQMFVEVYIPVEIRHPYPLVFIHGAGQTNLNWLGTPDGREGWADYFVRKGYVVYLAEQPARGRSAYHPEVDGARRYHTVEDIEGRFAGTSGKWKSASLHTQWPENALKMGMPLFDQFAAAQVEFMRDTAYTQAQVAAAAGDLLDKTGPAVLVTHSQSGPFGWKIGDDHPDLIKGIVALEPAGPTFTNDKETPSAKNYGVCELNMHFDPPVESPADFVLTRCPAERDGEADGWMMAEGHIHKLPGLSQVPVTILTAEASYHTLGDHVTAKVLGQMGVSVDFIRLGDIGIHGNSHFMMLEKNSLEIADLVDNWIMKTVEGRKEHE